MPGSKTVMVIDPDREVRELMDMFLSRLNVAVIAVSSGIEAVTCYRELLHDDMPPDLVVTALRLTSCHKSDVLAGNGNRSSMDGVHTVRRIRQIDPGAAIIGFTALAGMGWDEQFKQAGALHVWGKHIGFKAFAEKIIEMLA